MLQVLKNPVENALRYTPASGCIQQGLDLAICKALVTAQGGVIAAKSAGNDQGTTVTITLPPAPAA
jgi:signal transduction histidine kinase